MTIKKKSTRGKSIAKRLNAALTRRSLAKTLLVDLLAAAVVMTTWCLTVESSHGAYNVSNRSFEADGSADVIYNTVRCAADIRDYFSALKWGEQPDSDITLPFDGIYYTFRINTGTAAVDAAPVETVYGSTQGIAETAHKNTEDYQYYVDCGEGSETAQVISPTDEVAFILSPDEALPISGQTEAVETDENGVLHETEIVQTDDSASPEEYPSIETEEIYYYEVPLDNGIEYQPQYTEYQPQYTDIKVDASVILTLVNGALLVMVVLQTLGAIIKSLSGGGMIKRYLRPIDDIALMAEQLSSESHTTSESAIKATYTDRSVQNEPSDNEKPHGENSTKPGGLIEGIVDQADVESLTDAIEAIDDSRSRIEVQAPELSGLEAAVNNMLKRLEEGRRKQIRFVDDASHELRTPIAVIQGYANMLDRWGKDDPKIRDEAIEAIKNESEHIKTLLDQLLFLARGEMDRHVLELKPLSVDEILCEVMDESQMLDRKHTYELFLASGAKDTDSSDASAGESDFNAPREVLILADAAMIKQSIRILCDNAVKYTPEGGTISLKASERVSIGAKGQVMRDVCIDVSDTGIGISANELPRIFDRFYRGENARADNTGGSGLGLSIARWIVEQHNGRIEAISSPGIGTKMTIILPGYEGAAQ